nr:uncharacterized protein LOC123771800 [Procambarus clarkii]
MTFEHFRNKRAPACVGGAYITGSLGCGASVQLGRLSVLSVYPSCLLCVVLACSSCWCSWLYYTSRLLNISTIVGTSQCMAKVTTRTTTGIVPRTATVINSTTTTGSMVDTGLGTEDLEKL